MKKNNLDNNIVLVGGGVMSLTLAVLINEIYPEIQIDIIERLPSCGLESSDALNNAGTGHAGYCELNYTPINKKNQLNINKALEINENFETSLIFWAYLDQKYSFFNTRKFIKKTPHISFVSGLKNVSFLKKRYALLKKQPLFKEMLLTENVELIAKWAPLLLKGRKNLDSLAATKIDHGTDINFGELTNQLLGILEKKDNFTLVVNSEVETIKQRKDKRYNISIRNLKTNKKIEIVSNYTFLGSGGKTISMLQDMKLNEAKGYAGFPISGKWLICNKADLIKIHNAKVYTQVMDGAPPMSIPHLDLRVISNKKLLLFGPFAGFNPKLLKHGSFFDFPRSIKLNNIVPMTLVLFKNFSLLLYLIKQTLMNHASRIKELQKFYPEANLRDWKLLTAGQRVQIIKNCPFEGSKLEFGTEVIYSKNRKLAALIGASPGASVAVASMLDVFVNFFGNEEKKIRNLIPSYKLKLNDNPSVLKKIRGKTYKYLGLW
ncbi:MAG: malate:quinone oxidoreductase [Proteobacteria bacterium]|nr:malate:quinone oxidoreductase [Pseudomonadota bacterium]